MYGTFLIPTFQYQVKYYAFLNVLLNLTFKKLYAKYGANECECKEREIYYVNTISLRGFLDQSLLDGHDPNEILGYFVNFMLNKTNKDDTLLKDDVGDEFWRMARIETQKFNDRLENQEHLVEPGWALNLNPREQNCDYWLANIGNFV